MPGSLARGTRGPTYHPETFRKTSESSNQWNWIPGMQGLDRRCTETRHPRDKATGPGISNEDQGLRGSQDFVGFGTSWDSGLRGNQDFVGLRFKTFAGCRTSWDLGLSRK